MTLRKPDKVAKETARDEAMNFHEAQENRSNEFWNVLESDEFAVKPKEDARSDAEIMKDRLRIKMRLLSLIEKYTRSLADGKSFNLPSGWSDECDWSDIKFILAFDTSFSYLPDEDDDDENGDKYSVVLSETDYLDGETAFRFDVIKACNRLVLNGAALAKRIGSDSYRLWTDALIKLGDRAESVQCQAADDIVSALVRIWADLQIWIFMNQSQNEKKVKPKTKKAKR